MGLDLNMLMEAGPATTAARKRPGRAGKQANGDDSAVVVYHF